MAHPVTRAQNRGRKDACDGVGHGVFRLRSKGGVPPRFVNPMKSALVERYKFSGAWHRGANHFSAWGGRLVDPPSAQVQRKAVTTREGRRALPVGTNKNDSYRGIFNRRYTLFGCGVASLKTPTAPQGRCDSGMGRRFTWGARGGWFLPGLRPQTWRRIHPPRRCAHGLRWPSPTARSG